MELFSLVHSDNPVIDWKDANKYYGQYMIGEGEIVDTFNQVKYVLEYFKIVIIAGDFPKLFEKK